MNDITIRAACATDPFREIAACLYLTDPFIYPGAFGEARDAAASAISALMKIEHGLFHYQNIDLVLHRDKICGVLLHSDPNARWEQAVCNAAVGPFLPDLSDFIRVSEAYFSQEVQQPGKDRVEVIACCVLPEYRKLGIGAALMTHFMAQHRDKTVTLDVLAENAAAIALYQKCGFVIKEAYKGFHLAEEKRPDCYHMVRPAPKPGVDPAAEH